MDFNRRKKASTSLLTLGLISAENLDIAKDMQPTYALIAISKIVSYLADSGASVHF